MPEIVSRAPSPRKTAAVRLARAADLIYKVVLTHREKELSMKTILAAMLAGTFLVSLPSIVRADDKAPAGDSAKGKKDKKAADKGDKGAKKDDAAKSGGGW
jgi:hypothetical protein